MPYGDRQLSHYDVHNFKKWESDHVHSPLFFVFENIGDPVNIGSGFRLADALGVQKIFFLQKEEFSAQEQRKIQKVSRKTVSHIPHEIVQQHDDFFNFLRHTHVHTIAIEVTTRSQPFWDYVYPDMPIALIVGNERDGLTQDAINNADTIVEIPMLGNNSSMNVMTSLGIVSYFAFAQRAQRKKGPHCCKPL